MDWTYLLTPDLLARAATRPVVIYLHGAALHLGPDGDGIRLRLVPDWAVIETSMGSPAWRSSRPGAGTQG
jgi:hypothetical protein